jgi:hypothetical protein
MAADNLDAAPVADAALGLAIPVIDLREPRTVVVDEIAAACLAWGFFQIIGHGVDAALVERAMEETRAFFAAPKAAKRALSRSRENPWGFYDRELTKNARDKKEIFDIGPDAGGALVEGPFSGATPWPSWRPGFEPAMRAYFAACAEASAGLMSVVYEGLGARVSSLHDAFGADHTSFLRLNHYPVDDPLAGEAGDSADLGIHHHTDAGALALLVQNDVNGLQVYSDGLWHDVRPLAGAFVTWSRCGRTICIGPRCTACWRWSAPSGAACRSSSIPPTAPWSPRSTISSIQRAPRTTRRSRGANSAASAPTAISPTTARKSRYRIIACETWRRRYSNRELTLRQGRSVRPAWCPPTSGTSPKAT